MQIAIQACATSVTGVDICQYLEGFSRSIAGIKVHQSDLPARRLTVVKVDSGRTGESICYPA